MMACNFYLPSSITVGERWSPFYLRSIENWSQNESVFLNCALNFRFELVSTLTIQRQARITARGFDAANSTPFIDFSLFPFVRGTLCLCGLQYIRSGLG
jgi:hypothetical protein